VRLKEDEPQSNHFWLRRTRTTHLSRERIRAKASASSSKDWIAFKSSGAGILKLRRARTAQHGDSQKHPRYAELQYPAPLDLKAIQSLLDEQTLLLEYVLGKDGSFLFAVTRNDLIVARLPSAAPIADQVRPCAGQSRLSRSEVHLKPGYSIRLLYGELIEPAAKLLANKQKLIIVPSGILHYLPFEVLLSSVTREPSRRRADPLAIYVAGITQFSYVPSAGVLASLQSRPQARTQAKKTFLAFADPRLWRRPPNGREFL